MKAWDRLGRVALEQRSHKNTLPQKIENYNGNLINMMELYIETLTGAAFELRVSPFETIMSVKAKIQRLEGNCPYDHEMANV